jgi:hypothetical protein
VITITIRIQVLWIVVSGILKKCNAIIFRAQEVLLKIKKKKALRCLEVSEAANPVTQHHIPEELKKRHSDNSNLHISP